MRHVVDNTVDRTDVDHAMRRAIAETAGTFPHPNPRVGAVILDSSGNVVSSAAHLRKGEAHAEHLAIDSRSLPDHTLVVTLEPCNHFGSTPPCTEAIIESGIRRVVVGAVDPDPRVAGRGIERLREAGVDVTVGTLADEVEANDPAYFHHRRTGRAFATVKIASTLDGQTAAADGTSQWITGDESRADVHRLRAEHDAVLVGSGTVIADDPALTVRLEDYEGPQPRPVVLAGKRELPEGAQLLHRDPIVYHSDSLPDIDKVLTDLPAHGVLSVLVEAGPTIASAFIEAGAVDRLVWYVGGKLAGGTGHPAIAGVFETIAAAIPLHIDSVELLGGDLKISATVGER